VKLLLPELDEPPAESRAAVPDTTEALVMGQGETVLVVEDDAGVRRLTVMLLRGLGYQVFEAGSAREARELEPTLPELQLLLTDVVLAGGQNGPELARELLRARPGLSVLLMSGYVADSLDVAQPGRGFPLLDKPFRRAQLARAVRSALNA
jgi:CheY-like chemotaxis protein